MGDVLSMKQEPENSCDRFAVAVMKNGKVVCQVPRRERRAVYFFLSRDGHRGFCEVTAQGRLIAEMILE